MLVGQSKGAIGIMCLERVDDRFMLAAVATNHFRVKRTDQNAYHARELLDEVQRERPPIRLLSDKSATE